MAKKIKVIQCPQCGSGQNEQIKAEHYRCGNCRTEYFLDNDDVNINVNHQYGTKEQPATSLKASLLWSIGFIIVFAVVAAINLLSSDSGSSSFASFERKETFRENSRASFPFLHKDKIVLFNLTERTFRTSSDDVSKNGYYAVFYDLEKEEVLKADKLLDVSKSASASKVSHSYFESVDKHYIILDKRKIYEINTQSLTTKDVTVDIFNNDPEYQSGIASIDFSVYYDGDGLKVMTNLGKELYYYPSLQKTYTADEYNKARHHMNTLLPNAKERIYYTFTEKSLKYPDEILQLMEVVYLYNNGGPEHKRTDPSWSSTPKFDNNLGKSVYLKELFNEELHRIKSFKDMTPDRMYFEPRLLFSDEEHILITFKANLDPEVSTSLQLIDIKTGEPLWTESTDKSRWRAAEKCGDKFILIDHADILQINVDGKDKKEYKLKLTVEY